MERRRVLRLAQVLVASQMRSGRTTSTPNDFWGRPMALAIADVVLFLLTLGVASQVVGFLYASPSGTPIPSALLPEILAFLPLLVLGAVLLAGILFEMSTSSKFAASDAANWLPITPTEYVAASALAASFVYSLTAALALGVAVAVTWYTGNFVGLALATGCIGLALFEGSVLVEILRASTQRISSVVSKRTGRATIVLRLVLSVLLIVAFELAFNPVILFDVLQSVSNTQGWPLAIPFLWPSHALLAYSQGDLGTTALFGGASVALLAGFVALAAQVRIRFWAPAAAKLDLGTYRYAPAHPWLAAFGLSAGESSLVWKDLRGLVRRRELVGILVMPVVITLVGYLTQRSSGDVPGGFSSALIAAWTAGLFPLLLGATCIGQERRAIQTLYSLPIGAPGVFRAKVFSVLVPAFVFALVLWGYLGVLEPHTLQESIGLAVLLPTLAVVSCFIGLAFAARYSDFQERPRPRFLSPSAMIAAIFGGMAVIFLIAVPTLYWLYTASASVVDLAFPAALAVLFAAITLRSARAGIGTLMQAVPV